MKRSRSTPPDHIGWDLVRAARVWEAEFISEVASAGHPWFAEARGRLLEHVGRDGIGQGELARRADLTKQAVAQHLDQLEAEGLLRRVEDPSDSRKRRVVWTEKGEAALSEIDLAKRRVERRLKRRLGSGQFAALKAGLKAVIE